MPAVWDGNRWYGPEITMANGCVTRKEIALTQDSASFTMPTSPYSCRTYGFDLQNDGCGILRCTPICFHTMVVETWGCISCRTGTVGVAIHRAIMPTPGQLWGCVEPNSSTGGARRDSAYGLSRKLRTPVPRGTSWTWVPQYVYSMCAYRWVLNTQPLLCVVWCPLLLFTFVFCFRIICCSHQDALAALDGAIRGRSCCSWAWG